MFKDGSGQESRFYRIPEGSDFDLRLPAQVLSSASTAEQQKSGSKFEGSSIRANRHLAGYGAERGTMHTVRRDSNQRRGTAGSERRPSESQQRHLQQQAQQQQQQQAQPQEFYQQQRAQQRRRERERERDSSSWLSSPVRDRGESKKSLNLWGRSKSNRTL